MRDFLDGMEIARDPDALDLAPSWNVAPTQPIDIAYTTEGKLTSTTARWWFVPEWFQGGQADWKQTTFNARIETAAERPTFRTAWAHQRCIIPALGYYEWTGKKGAKQPYWITTQRNGPALFFSGLYAYRPEGHSCTILTRPALTQIAHIHPRTPVILTDEELAPWLRGDLNQAQNTLGTGWDGRMAFHQVAPIRSDDDSDALIEPI